MQGEFLTKKERKYKLELGDFVVWTDREGTQRFYVIQKTINFFENDLYSARNIDGLGKGLCGVYETLKKLEQVINQRISNGDDFKILSKHKYKFQIVEI